MATKLCRSSRAFATALRPAQSGLQARNGEQVVRCIATTARQNVAIPRDIKNMRLAPRDQPKELHVPVVNPADKYANKADALHRYGSWLMGCLPKNIQQFSVWKDELVIYIPPAGVIPVFSFLKCMNATSHWTIPHRTMPYY
jgi:NADH dehydrogenase (ubiquinone) Fe-S protein 3